MDMEEIFVAKADYGRREITAPVLIPEPYVDAHGDIISEEEVYKACRNFNEHCMQANLQHQFQLDPEVMSISESYLLQKSDADLPKGTWMMTMKCKSDTLLDAVRDKKFNGFSIAARAKGTAL